MEITKTSVSALRAKFEASQGEPAKKAEQPVASRVSEVAKSLRVHEETAAFLMTNTHEQAARSFWLMKADQGKG